MGRGRGGEGEERGSGGGEGRNHALQYFALVSPGYAHVGHNLSP